MIYAIGDIHGCLEPLAEALECIISYELQPDDTVVFLGDYIDRGKQSREVVETLLEWEKAHPKTVFLRGNHEDMLLQALKEWSRHGREARLFTEELQLWWQNGGSATLQSYGPFLKGRWPTAIPHIHWDFLDRTRLEYVEGGYHFVHAGLLPTNAVWEYPDEDPRLWIREPFLSSEEEFGGKIVVFGHTPQLNFKPLVMSNKIGLDTALVFGGLLTLARLDPNAQGEDRLHFEIRQF